MHVTFISVPYDSGRYDTGSGRGPASILDTGIADQLRTSGHVVDEQTLTYLPKETLTDVQSAFRLNALLSAAVSQAITAGSLPIILAGNCITAVGTMSGLSGRQTGVLWFDAHGDLNTPETTRSGCLDGMALAIACGHCWTSLAAMDPGYRPIPEDQVVLLGARDLDPAEEQALQTGAIKQVTAKQIRQNDCELPEIAAWPWRDVYVHFDADVLDAGVGRANRFAAANGLFPDEVKRLLSWVIANFSLQALAVTAYDPQFDTAGIVRQMLVDILHLVVR
jgi:arginase